MADEGPKDYSRLYTEKQAPRPIPPNRIRPQQQKSIASMDGAFQPLKHREQNKQDLREFVLKLNNQPPQCHLDANRALSEHYKLCFQKPKPTNYRVLIRYPSVNNKANETFAVRVESNTLRSIKEKLPIRGNYRYFFKTNNCLEEIESDDSKVPTYNERDGINQIHVHLFNRT